MTELLNHTSFSAALLAAMDPHARVFDVVVVSATFEAPPNKPLRLADEQLPVRDVDEYYSEPGLSSIRYEGETAWEKPFVDVLVNGTAYAPGSRRAKSVLVSVGIGDIRKELQVSGDRYWRRGLRGRVPSSSRPFETMPIVYERAFGGMDTRPKNPAKHRSELRNPIGVGFQGAPSQSPSVETEIPNVEYPGRLMRSSRSRPEPAGFGVVGRDWQPRLGYAGTYDAAWLAEQSPLLPYDFDICHFQAASRDQQSTSISGGEPVQLRNMTPEGTWEFSLPTLEVPLRLLYPSRKQSGSLKLDTVLIEPDFHRVTLIARANIPVIRKLGPLEEVIIGHVTRGWWRARMENKHYLDSRGAGGRLLGVRDFSV
jgi:hypothetical protein